MFREGWLLRQLEAASKTVASWPKAKQESMSLNRKQKEVIVEVVNNLNININAEGKVKISDKAKLPEKARVQDAALDISSSEDAVVPKRGRALISTGVYVAIPENFVGLLWSRSGLAVKYGIAVGAGCIDNTYRGEVKVLLFNHSDDDFVVSSGDRIAQLLTVPISVSAYNQVDDLEDTSRGDKGFGSSGVKGGVFEG